MLNPIRSEGEAFRFLLWIIAIVGATAIVVLLIRALS